MTFFPCKYKIHSFLIKRVWALLPRFTVKQWETLRVGIFGNRDGTVRNQWGCGLLQSRT